MKYLVLALALAVSTPAVASKNCDVFSDVVYRIATERDSGVSRREMRSRVISQVDQKMLEAFLALVDMVYKEPHLKPEFEASKFYQQCMEMHGTKTGYTF